MITKTRQQGNSSMITFLNGVKGKAKLVENGMLYEFVEPKKSFLISVKIF